MFMEFIGGCPKASIDNCKLAQPAMEAVMSAPGLQVVAPLCPSSSESQVIGYGSSLFLKRRSGSQGALPSFRHKAGCPIVSRRYKYSELASFSWPSAQALAAKRVEAATLDLPAGDANDVVPAAFVFPESSRATLSYDVFDLDLPVIDLGVFAQLDALRREIDTAGAHQIPGIRHKIAECQVEGDKVLQQLRAACEEYGFFQIVNHGFPMPLVDNLRDIAQAFFNRPLEDKCKTSNPKRLTGYISGLPTSSDKQRNRLWRETFGVRMVLGRSGSDTGIAHLARHLAGDPEQGPMVSQAVHTYVRTMEAVALHLLELLAQSFGLSETTFSQHFRDKADRTCLFQINHYPVCPQPDLALGTHRHTDPFAINIVHQNAVGGLQVLTADGEWHGVKPIPGAFVVNAGDLLQMWTNDRLLSSEHRVVGNRDQSRMSFCFFYNPSKQACIVPPAQFVDEEHPRRYRPFQTVEFSDVVTSHGASRRGIIVQKFGLNCEEDR